MTTDANYQLFKNTGQNALPGSFFNSNSTTETIQQYMNNICAGGATAGRPRLVL